MGKRRADLEEFSAWLDARPAFDVLLDAPLTLTLTLSPTLTPTLILTLALTPTLTLTTNPNQVRVFALSNVPRRARASTALEARFCALPEVSK